MIFKQFFHPQVHLKRFQFTTYSRRKLHNLVKFPINDLDMSPYVVRESAVNEPESSTNSTGASVEKKEEGDDGGLLSADEGRSEGQYELYAVVHHLVSART